jgi:CHAT domain-containing protein
MMECKRLPEPKAPAIFISHFAKSSSNEQWSKIEGLIAQGGIPRACRKLKSQLNRKLTQEEHQHALLQLAFAHLLMEKPSAAKKQITRFLQHHPDTAKLDAWAKGHLYYNLALLKYQELFLLRARKYAGLAMRHLGAVYPEAHYYTSMAYCQMGMILYDINPQYHGLNDYTRKANDFFQAHPELWQLNWENLLSKAQYESLNSRNLESRHLTETALIVSGELPFKLPVFQARCLAMQAFLLKKEGETSQDSSYFYHALELQQKALRLLKPSESLRKQELWRDVASLSTKFKGKEGDKLFNSSLKKLTKHIKRVDRDVFGFPVRLEAFRAYHVEKNPEKTIALFRSYMATARKDEVKQRHFSEAFFCIRSSYLKLHNYQKAIETSKEMLRSAGKADPKAIWEPKLGIKVANNQGPWMQTFQTGIAYLNWSKALGKDTLDWEKLTKAIEFFELSDERFLSSLLYTNEDNLVQYQARVSEFYSHALDAVFLAHQMKPSEKWINLGIRFAERFKSYLLLRDLNLSLLDQEQSNAYNAVKTELDNYYLREKNKQAFSTKELIKVQKLEAKRFTIFKKLRQLSIHAAQQQIPTANETRNALGASRQMIQYAIADTFVYSIYIGPQGINLKRMPTPELAKKINAVYQFLTHDKWSTKQEKENYLKYAHELYGSLIKPHEAILKQGKTTLVVPDRILHHLPFDILLASEIDLKQPTIFKKLPYLVWKIPILYTPSIKLWLEKHKNSDPLFEAAHKEIWDDNPFGLDDGEPLVKTFGSKVTYIKGDSCSADNFMKNLDGMSGMLHVIVHSSSNDSNRLDNYFSFKEKNDKALVYGYQLTGFDLSKVNLLFLAACKSSFGKTSGEGAYSLSRYALEAGVNKVIGSQWKVRAKATQDLAQDFYAVYKKENNVERALWKAKLNYLKAMPDSLCAPYYWSALIPMQ